ncbi:unnamed protein product [Anisakis simplex]|uniref:Ubiquitin-like domain-containing protein n=1 Tax=Anisakis simplex TaxID=6269 RepID=A0A0M3KAQ0_ANISI|nr:unnamed protein product [Anisakis simplex]
MLVFVKNEHGETLSIDVQAKDDVRALWNEIQAEVKDRDLSNARLLFNGVELEDSKPLKHYQIEEASVIHLEG